MKIKKQHRKKKYLHKLNRKRMHHKQRSTGEVDCKPIKDAWDFKKSSLRNMKEMGLASDPNKVIKIPNFKQEKVRIAKKIVNQDDSEDDTDEEDEVTQPVPKKEVVEVLEKEARAPRVRRFMCGVNGQCEARSMNLCTLELMDKPRTIITEVAKQVDSCGAPTQSTNGSANPAGSTSKGIPRHSATSANSAPARSSKRKHTRPFINTGQTHAESSVALAKSTSDGRHIAHSQHTNRAEARIVELPASATSTSKDLTTQHERNTSAEQALTAIQSRIVTECLTVNKGQGGPNQRDITRRVRCRILVPNEQGFFKDTKVIGRLLAYQNLWIGVDKWTLIKATQQKKSWILLVGVPEDQIPALMEASRCLTLTMGTVYLKFLGPTGRFVDVPQGWDPKTKTILREQHCPPAKINLLADNNTN